MREDGWSGMWLDLVERQKVKGARRAIYNCNGWMKCTQMSRRHLGGSKLTTFRMFPTLPDTAMAPRGLVGRQGGSRWNMCFAHGA